MNYKKILLVIGMVFLLTGCTASYELTYEDGVFSEHIVVKELNTGNDDYLSITDVQNNPSLIKIDDNNSYKYNLSKDGEYDVLTLDFDYKDISLEKSLIYQECFEYKMFEEKDDYYIIRLEGKTTCEYLTSVDVVFKSDKVVINSNAEEKDEEEGIYKWNDFTGGEIMLQVSKVDTLSKNGSYIEMIPWYVKLIISLVVGLIIFFVYKKIKRNQEF
jgi:hypothetical protein